MRFEEALVGLKAGKRAFFGEMEPFDLDSIPNLTGGDYTRDDWQVVNEPLSDEALVAKWTREAEKQEAEAAKRETERMAKWEAEAAEARAKGAEEPLKPRNARSSIALTLRRCAQEFQTRQAVSA